MRPLRNHCSLAILLLTATALSATPIYQVTALNLGAAGMNNLGDVVGSNASGSVLYRYASGTYFNLGSLGGGYATTPVAINDRGSMAGSLVYSDGSTRAFFYEFTGVLTVIDPLPGQTQSHATQLNNSSRVIGDSGSPLEGFLYTGFGPATSLGVQTQPRDINDSNVIVGQVFSSQGQRAFMLSGSTFTNLGVLDPSHTTSSAAGINDNGDIVGFSYNNSTAQSFLYRNGAMTALPQMGGNRPTLAKDINNAGVIIGDYVSTSGVRQFVVIDGLIYDINELIDPAWTGGLIFGSSVAINNAGQILINGTGNQSYLLTPTSGSGGGGGGTGEVPEPSAFALTATGLAAAAAFVNARRRRAAGYIPR